MDETGIRHRIRATTTVAIVVAERLKEQLGTPGATPAQLDATATAVVHLLVAQQCGLHAKTALQDAGFGLERVTEIEQMIEMMFDTGLLGRMEAQLEKPAV